MSKYLNISTTDKANFAKALQSGTVYFVGIGGIGMSALAKYFFQQGCTVSGYDKTETALTISLAEQGMTIHYTDDVSLLAKNADIVIYTPAIPSDHTELQFYKNNQYTILKRSQVLGLLTLNSNNICVAGTHGKTTVSTMVSHILHDTQYGCNAFLGGISTNYNTNFLSSKNNVCVIEADEYDRSFLQLTPSMAVITSMDADHLDIYGTTEAMHEAFIQFTEQIQPQGLLVTKYGLPKNDLLKADIKYTYHLNNKEADVYAKNIEVKNGSYQFDIVLKGQEIPNLMLNVGGLHNIENALAAITIANHLQIDMEAISQAVARYKGVKRRFEYYIEPNQSEDVIMIDDYAHHPTELKALITGVKSLFGTREIVLVFQPHLYTRTRDFAVGFSESLSMVDEVILLPIYPARELPIEGVSSDMLLNQITITNKRVVEKDGLVEWVKNDFKKRAQNKVLVMAGAGDIDTLLTPVKNSLIKE